MKRLAICLCLALGLPATATAADLLESYTAFLSSNDHYNSRGQRLTRAWQIIRQDRANFHRFGTGDNADEWDSFFASQENRAIAERMVRDGRIQPSAARRIVNEEVTIRVDIYGHGSQGSYLDITVY